MKLISSLSVAVVGLAITAWAYFGYVRLDAAAPWSSGLIYLGDGPRVEAREPIPFRHLPTVVRELPPGPIADVLLQAVGRQETKMSGTNSIKITLSHYVQARSLAMLAVVALRSSRWRRGCLPPPSPSWGD
ncbi:MAG: hypothetical protein ACLQNE_31195 [Thermoguttaceae bacterium]